MPFLVHYWSDLEDPILVGMHQLPTFRNAFIRCMVSSTDLERLTLFGLLKYFFEPHRGIAMNASYPSWTLSDFQTLALR
jgi:hypothetical protein